jgi:hypothetical protein
MTLSSQQYANLSDHSYGRNLDQTAVDLKSLVGKSIEIEGVQYKVLAHADKPSGYQGTIYQCVDTGEIVVAHRGTEFNREPLKDGLRADGGMVLGQINSQASDAIELTRVAFGWAQEYARRSGAPVPEVTVTGHSLGGTLAQITAHHFDLRGETFNAYGAASLGYRIPEGGDRVLNHVMAADVVSSASPHYGQVRVYAMPREIAQLQASGYGNSWLGEVLVPDRPVLASINGSHMMHNFLNVDGDGRRDVSILGDASARSRADDNTRMISDYRGDVGRLRAAASAGGLAAEVLGGGPLRAIERMREEVLPDLPPGEPARRESHSKGAVPRHDTSGIGAPRSDMRDDEHPANGKYRQAYAGVVGIDRSLGRVPDGDSERLAAALTAAGAAMPAISHVVLNRDGTRAFAVDTPDITSPWQQRVHVDVASAVHRPVEASTRDWQAASQQSASQQREQLAREPAQPEVRGPVMA